MTNYMLSYPGGDICLCDYTDTDWDYGLDQRKSTPEYAFLQDTVAIYWESKKQSCITLSTVESEYHGKSKHT